MPISYPGRTVAEGKKIGWNDAFSAVWTLFRYRFLDDRFTTHDGYYILQSMRRARGLNRWILEQIRPFVGSRVLEAGCGIGNFTELLLDRERLVCVDNDPFYVEMINWRLGHLENFRILQMDLADAADYAELKQEALDTIICLNVLEHIKADEEVLRAYYDLLEPGGHAIILVPAHMWLYGPCDAAIGHERRYTQARAAHEDADGRLRDRADERVQPPRRAGLVAEQGSSDAAISIRARCGSSSGCCRSPRGPKRCTSVPA